MRRKREEEKVQGGGSGEFGEAVSDDGKKVNYREAESILGR